MPYLGKTLRMIPRSVTCGRKKKLLGACDRPSSLPASLFEVKTKKGPCKSLKPAKFQPRCPVRLTVCLGRSPPSAATLLSTGVCDTPFSFCASSVRGRFPAEGLRFRCFCAVGSRGIVGCGYTQKYFYLSECV